MFSTPYKFSLLIVNEICNCKQDLLHEGMSPNSPVYIVNKDQLVYVAGNRIMSYNIKTQAKKQFIDYDQENLASFLTIEKLGKIPVRVTFFFNGNYYPQSIVLNVNYGYTCRKQKSRIDWQI